MSQFRNLVFEGGGVKGIGYVGAVEVLEEHQILPGINRVGGTSAGAITSSMLALGANKEEIKEIVAGTSFREFMDRSWTVVGDVKRLMKDFGWFKGERFANWLKENISELTGGREQITFGELARLADTQPDGERRRYRRLHTVATNVSRARAEVFNAKRTPDVPIWYAVRMSMALPLVFACVRRADDIMADGAISWNYPIDLFDDRRFLSDPSRDETFQMPHDVGLPTAKSESHIHNLETLGFRVGTTDEIKAAVTQQDSRYREIDGLKEFCNVVIGYMSEMANRQHLSEDDWHRTVFIEAGGIQSNDFDLSDEQIDMLIANGRKSAEAYFAWFNDHEEGDRPLNKILSPTS